MVNKRPNAHKIEDTSFLIKIQLLIYFRAFVTSYIKFYAKKVWIFTASIVINGLGHLNLKGKNYVIQKS
jgi:hypothetical protein